MVEGHGRKAYGFESRLGHIKQLGPDANAFGLYCFSGKTDEKANAHEARFVAKRKSGARLSGSME